AEVLAYRVRRQSHVLTDQLQIENQAGLEEKYAVRLYRDLDAALAQHPHAALICNPSSLHVAVALKAAEAGCHLLLEKPLSHNLEQVDELIRLMDGKGLVGLVGYQMRFHPCLRRLHELLTTRAVGRIVAVRAEVGEYLPSWHPYEDYRQMYASRAELGGGVVLSQIHEIDYIYWLFGMPRRVFAIGGHLSSLEIDVEDTASILMECVVDGRPIPVHLHQDYVQRPPNRSCQVIGDDGKILVDFRNLYVKHFDGSGSLVAETSFVTLQRNQLFLDEMKHFLACVERRELPLVSVNDGAQSLRIALAAKQSLSTRRPVDLGVGEP
ncbi:MAG: Gfo/Idh/MocA family oxidoreductase, partial [Thermoguttaceae bacterium]